MPGYNRMVTVAPIRSKCAALSRTRSAGQPATGKMVLSASFDIRETPVLIVVTDVVLYLSFPVIYDLLSQCNDYTPALIVYTYLYAHELFTFLRFAAFVTIIVMFVRAERANRQA